MTPDPSPAAALSKPTLGAHVSSYLASLALRYYSEFTIANRRVTLGYFLAWCAERSIEQPEHLTRVVLESYMRWLSQVYKTSFGKPLAFGSQASRFQAAVQLCRWLTRNGYLTHNPASDLERVRRPRPLPRSGFTVTEMESILALPDVANPIGLRDRTVMEVLYASAMRRLELAKLHIRDIDQERAAATVREGKFKKGRTVPLGSRALGWINRYLVEARPWLTMAPDDGFLFLNNTGEPMSLPLLSYTVRQYIIAAGLSAGRPGSCHLFRHSAATLMMERGADLKLVQEMLGHADMSTTAIYLTVTIPRLLMVHAATHPSSPKAPREPVIPGAVELEAITKALSEEAEE